MDNVKWLIGGVILGVLFVCFLIWWSLFVPPYNVPQFKDIENNQTAFLIPLDGDVGTQTHFQSAEFLAQRKVASQRVQISRRWIQKGRTPASGDYMDTVRLLVVDRSPVVKEWMKDATKGTSSHDESIDATSKDGIRFHVGFTVTAYIEEPKTHEFLYMYRGDSLGNVMDKEMRARVTTVITEYCSKTTMDALRGHQGEMVELVKKDIVPFFEKRGVTVTSAGVVGGFSYDNAAVQGAIDKTIQDQQLKVSAEARRESQMVENMTIKLAAEGKAESIKIEAKARADALKMETDATSYQLEKAATDKSLYLSIRNLEVEVERLKRWNGQYPQFLLNGGSSQTPFLFTAPMPTQK